MHHNKNSQKEVLVTEAVLWTFLVTIFAVGYQLAKVTF
jgi:hypothetical protein